MIYRTIAMTLLALVAGFLAMRYNLHMLQLNGYKNLEHLNRYKKSWTSQWLLYAVTAFGIARLFLTGLGFDIGGAVLLLLTILVYNLYRKTKAKKKLVYTARVKRMLAAHVVVSLVFPVAAFFVLGLDSVNGGLLIMVGLQWILPVVTNFLMKPAEKAVSRHYVNDAKRLLREAKGLKIIGVTGSYGKTSVKFYLKTLLSAKYDVLVTPESFNTPMGVVRTIREQLKPSHEIFICEMGARHVGDIREICDIVHPMHGMITSIGPQHLETFFHMDNIRNTKFELADALPKDGMLFLNGDNSYIRETLTERNGIEQDGKLWTPEGRKLFLYHAGESTDGYYAKNVKVSSMGTEFTVVTPNGDEETFSMRLIGEHNVINVMGAIAVAHRLGVSLGELKVPVRRLEPVAHRMQLLERGSVTIIDDAYNSNPVGSKAAVETLKMFDGVKILVTPGMVELGENEEAYNRAFGTYAADCCDYICLVGRKRTEPIAEGVLQAGFAQNRLKAFDRLEEAMQYAYSIADEGHKYILLENDLPYNY